MLFFKRILQPPPPPAAPEAPRVERRSTRRFTINPKFPLKAVLSFVPRDDTGAPMNTSRHGWNWKGRLFDCSEQGARIVMGPTLKVEARDLCDLSLTIDDFNLNIPCHISNLREHDGGMIFGLKHNIAEEATRIAYQQLLEVLALGSALKLQSRTAKPDATGYLVEVYASDRPARLTIWRHKEDKSVGAFEFQLKDSLVRGAAGRAVRILAGTGADARPAPAAKAMEIQRLFHWVVPNLAASVPEDVRIFLQKFVA